MSEIICDGFDFEMVPIKAAEENKTGITIKGKDVAYIEAHRILKDFFRTRGQKFYINGIELRIVDLPRNKLIKGSLQKKKPEIYWSFTNPGYPPLPPLARIGNFRFFLWLFSRGGWL